MKGAIWFAAGATAGIYAMIRGRRAAEAFTVDGLRDRFQALGVGARLLRDEVAAGYAEREAELRERYAAAYDTSTALPAGTGRPHELRYDEEGSTP